MTTAGMTSLHPIIREAERRHLPAGAKALLHSDRGRDRRGRRGHCQALTVGRVDDRDGIPGPGRGWLV